MSNYRKISKNGLIPQLGRFSAKASECKSRIYCFNSLDSLDDALCNWLSEEYEELEEVLGKNIKLAVLEVDLSGLNISVQKDANGEVFYEQQIEINIPPERINLIRVE